MDTLIFFLFKVCRFILKNTQMIEGLVADQVYLVEGIQCFTRSW